MGGQAGQGWISNFVVTLRVGALAGRPQSHHRPRQYDERHITVSALEVGTHAEQLEFRVYLFLSLVIENILALAVSKASRTVREEEMRGICFRGCCACLRMSSGSI
jgi:hypothetical protein